MEILTPPKSKPETDQWYGNINAGGPSQPRIVETNEYAEKPMFIHPAEKPQGNGPGYRPQLYESL